MKKQYNLIKSLLMVVTLLAVFQVMLLLIAPDTKHIILTIIVFIGLILVFIFFLISRKEANNILFESTKENVEIRLVNYDDFPHLRQLLDETPLENSEEERTRLEEYEKITVDYVRIKYHYIVLIDSIAVGLFKSSKQDEIWTNEWIKVSKDVKDNIQSIILNNTTIDKTKIVFK